MARDDMDQRNVEKMRDEASGPAHTPPTLFSSRAFRRRAAGSNAVIGSLLAQRRDVNAGIAASREIAGAATPAFQ
jgi:hypothetical protein